MTLADQAAITGQDGQVTSNGKPGRPKRRTFTAAYKARILAAFDALPEGSPERGALLRKERLYHSHLEDWRRQQAAGCVHSRGSVNWCQAMAGSGGSQGFPAMALLMASSAVMPWAAAESR